MKTLDDASTKDVVAIKRTISKTLRSRLRERGATVASIARDTGTSRTAIRRVLDEDNTSITLHTMVKTAFSLGYRVRLILEPSIEKIERVAPPMEVEPLMRKLGESLDRLPMRR
jgi:antitoxin HicB